VKIENFMETPPPPPQHNTISKIAKRSLRFYLL
jgi:hypothetical protein